MKCLRKTLVAATLASWVVPAAVFAVPAEQEGSATLVLDPEAGRERTAVERWIRSWQEETEVQVETHPADAELELVYVRAEATQIRRRVSAPVRLVLPSIRDGDVVWVRAHRDGHRIHEVALHAARIPARLEIALEPLPNSLVAAAHLNLVGRRLLLLWTEEPARIRIQEAGDAVHVVLTQTRSDLIAPPGTALESVGEDLFLEVRLELDWREQNELRAHQARDPARGLERIVVEWVPRDDGLAAIERARQGLAALGPRDVDVCAQVFEDQLRAAVPRSSLARGVAPTGHFIDAIRRGALRRLAELTPGGFVELFDGTRFDPTRPLEADFVLGRASEVRGYLALLAGFVNRVTPPREADEVLASLVAPDLPAAEVGRAIAEARTAERVCRASSEPDPAREPNEH